MQNIFEKLSLESDSCALITSPRNMRYFSGFSGGEGYVLIMKNNKYIFVDSRYTGAASEEAYDGFEVSEFSLKNTLKAQLSEKISDNGIKYMLYEDAFMTCFELNKLKKILPSVEFVPKSDELDKMRMIKTEEEVELIAKAEEIGVQAFKQLLPYIKPGVTETELAAELEYRMRKLGAQKTSFDTIVLGGERCALPHGVPGDRRIKNDEAVLMDFGCVYKGYCSDMTRTVFVGKASERDKKIYNIVKAAQQVGLDTIREGITGRDADSAARKVIEDAGYGKYFGHSLGHGVGLEIHELPNLSQRSDIVLKENMIVSCEPGIYIYGEIGVRIEDLVCVKKDGIRNFADLTHELIEL